MKRSLILVAASGLALTLLTVPTAATAATDACARMGNATTILGQPTATCVELYTSGSSSIQLPPNTPRIIYGVVNMVSPGVAPTTFTDQLGNTYAMNPREGDRWLGVGPTTAAQTIVKGEIVNNRIGKTFPYLYITDDAITDRFAGKSFISRTKTGKNAKKPLSIWSRFDWADGLSADGGLKGVIANYKRNIEETKQCKPKMVAVGGDRVREVFGTKGRVKMVWKPGVYQGQNSFLQINTETSAVYTHPAPTALKLTRKVWKPGTLGFSRVGSKSGLSQISVNDIRKSGVVKTCTLP